MIEFLSNMLNVYAISFLIGFFIFAFLLVSKTLLIFLFFMKKQVALGTTVIVLSESVVGLSLFLLILRFEVDSGYLMIGFVSGLFLSLIGAAIWVFFKLPDSDENESIEKDAVD